MPVPRPWVPGVLYVRDDGRVVTGPGAGASLADDDIRHWKSVITLVRRADLTSETCRATGLVLPEERIDPVARPNVRRAVQELRWLALLPGTERGLPAKVESVEIGYHRVSDGFHVSRMRHGASPVGTGGGLWDHDYVFADGAPAIPDPEVALDEVAYAALEDEGARIREGVVDRAIRMVTDGALTEVEVAAADHARGMTHRWSGGRFGGPRDVAEVTLETEAVEPQWAEVFARAEGQRALAERVVARIAEAPDDARSLEVEGFGALVRRRDPALHVRGEAAEFLPDDDYWVLPDHDGWRPQVPEELVRRARERTWAAQRDLQAAAKRSRTIALLGIGVALVLVIALLLLRR